MHISVFLFIVRKRKRFNLGEKPGKKHQSLHIRGDALCKKSVIRRKMYKEEKEMTERD